MRKLSEIKEDFLYKQFLNVLNKIENEITKVLLTEKNSVEIIFKLDFPDNQLVGKLETELRNAGYVFTVNRNNHAEIEIKIGEIY